MNEKRRNEARRGAAGGDATARRCVVTACCLLADLYRGGASLARWRRAVRPSLVEEEQRGESRTLDFPSKLFCNIKLFAEAALRFHAIISVFIQIVLFYGPIVCILMRQ